MPGLEWAWPALASTLKEARGGESERLRALPPVRYLLLRMLLAVPLIPPKLGAPRSGCASLWFFGCETTLFKLRTLLA